MTHAATLYLDYGSSVSRRFGGEPEHICIVEFLPDAGGMIFDNKGNLYVASSKLTAFSSTGAVHQQNTPGGVLSVIATLPVNSGHFRCGH